MGSIYAAGSSNLLARRWARSSSCSSLSCSELSHLCFSLSLTWNLSSIKRVFCCCVCAACRLFHRTTRTKVSNILFFTHWRISFDAVHSLMLWLAPVSWQRWLLYQQVFFVTSSVTVVFCIDTTALRTTLCLIFLLRYWAVYRSLVAVCFFPSRLLNAIVVHQLPGWRILIATQHLFKETFSLLF